MTNMTINDATDYCCGDWIAHCHHGIGQLEAVERKRIGNHENTYCRIKMADYVIWVPLEQMGGEQFRPIADEGHFQEALEVLKKPPEVMASNQSTRKARIKQVTLNNVPDETARLIRDLRARRKEKKGLNQNERRALHDLTRRFLQEWSVCVGLTLAQARSRLNRQLRRSRAIEPGQLAATQKKDETKSDSTSTVLAGLSNKDARRSEWFNEQLAKGV